MSSKDTVAVAEFANQAEASLALSVLSQAGVASWLEDEQLVNQVWYLGNAVGGIKLVVEGKDEASAKEALKSIIRLGVAPERDVELNESDRIAKKALFVSVFALLVFLPVFTLVSLGYKVHHRKALRAVSACGRRWLRYSNLVDAALVTIGCVGVVTYVCVILAA